MDKLSRRDVLQISGAAMAGAMLSAEKSNAETAPPKKKIIVAGAHPDDPETGCGGLMARLAQAGHEVVAAYLTRGEAGIPGTPYDEAAAIRTKEAEQACAILGARPAFLGQIDGSAEITPQRYKDINTFFEKEKPDLVLTHWPVDTHRDHRICSILVYDAWLNLGRSFALNYYEVMAGIQTQNFTPTDYVDITTVREQKHKACFVHVSQGIREMYDNEHGKMEAFRGLEGGFKYAESYIKHNQSIDLSLNGLL